MKRLILGTFAVVFLSSSICAKSWRGITPLHSTRSDVERVLGKPVLSSNHSATYYTDKEAISVLYSNGLPCGAGANSEWNVPAGRVVSITVAMKVIVSFSSLNLDESKYRKSADPHMLDATHYANLEEGEFISVVNGEVKSLNYTPGSASNHLKCPSIPTQPTPPSAFKLDEYGDLQPVDEESRLDNFAITLTQMPGSKGYIIVYSGGTITPAMARSRARRAKNYLTRTRKVNASRIVTRYISRRTDFSIELYVAPKGSSEPVPFIPRQIANPAKLRLRCGLRNSKNTPQPSFREHRPS